LSLERADSRVDIAVLRVLESAALQIRNGSSQDRNGRHSHAMKNLCCHTNVCVGVAFGGATLLGQSKIGCRISKPPPPRFYKFLNNQCSNQESDKRRWVISQVENLISFASLAVKSSPPELQAIDRTVSSGVLVFGLRFLVFGFWFQVLNNCAYWWL